MPRPLLVRHVHPSMSAIRRPGDVIASEASAVAVTHRRPGEARPPRPAAQATTSSVMRWCVTVCVIDRDVPSYFRSLEHLLRYCARPPFALERLSVSRGADGQIARIRYVLPRRWVILWAANWVGRSRSRKSTRPGANGVVDLSPFEFLDRLADLVPPPRKHRHRYHGVFAPNHRLRKAVTSLAIGNVGRGREAVTGGHAAGGRATAGCCDANPNQKPRSHDTSRIAWAKLMARVGEEFPLACPTCGGDIRLIAFITDPGPIRKILTHLGELLEPPPVSPADRLGQARADP